MKYLQILPLLFIVFVFGTAHTQSAGSLIPGFGDNGKVITQNGNYLCAQRAIADNNGKILVLARINLNPSQLALSRYLSNGNLDASFGTNGTVITPIKAGQLTDLAIQPDGKILVTCQEETFPSGLWVARYLANGALDVAFGMQGIFKSTISGSRGTALATTSEGKIVSVGTLFNASTQGMDIFLTRLLANGTLDVSFGNNGSITHDFGASELVFEVAIQSDGKIVVFGASTILPTYSVFRFMANGMPDTNFGTNGRIVLSQIAPLSWGDLSIQSDGKIVLGGTADNGVGEYQFWVSRLQSNGNPDPAFGQNGVAKTNFTSPLKGEALLIDPQGRYIVGGEYQPSGSNKQMALTRFTPQGVTDVTFGNNGLAIVTFGTGFSESCLDLTQLSNGHIIAVGCAQTFPNARTIIAGLYPGTSSDVTEPVRIPEFYPNPASDWIYTNGLEDEQLKLTLTNTDGRVIRQLTVIDGKISVADLPSGLYYVVCHLPKGNVAYPVTVLR
ncbi:MAG TPA: T9SS type A sorting domain-containing protein [Saprospiraceae bacterium]|nr:T9SS type A sorting domain-containing protein [Saprospiraceae bacterium]